MIPISKIFKKPKRVYFRFNLGYSSPRDFHIQPHLIIPVGLKTRYTLGYQISTSHGLVWPYWTTCTSHGSVFILFSIILLKSFFNHRSLSEQSLNTFHHAHCYIPAEIKYVLDQKPSLISPIVRAFCERDPIDMKVCHIYTHISFLYRCTTVFTWSSYFLLINRKFLFDILNLAPRITACLISSIHVFILVLEIATVTVNFY